MYRKEDKLIQSNKTIIHLREELLWYLVLICLLSVTLIIQYIAKSKALDIANFYIPDSNTYEIRVFSSQDLEGFSATVYNNFNKILYNISPQSFLWFNASLLFISLNLCRNVFKHVSKASINYARLAIVANPYILIGAIGPNKETILIFICLLFWTCFLNIRGAIRFPISVLVLLLSLAIRPVVCVPLVINLTIYIFAKNIKNPGKIIFKILIIYFLANSIPFINELLASVHDDNLNAFTESRIYDVATSLNSFSQHPILQYPAFIIKSAILLFGFIIRPIQLLAQPLPLLDIGYSFLAYLFFPFNLSLVITLLTNKWNKKMIVDYSMTNNLLVFVSLSYLTIILNPILTFRYLFPYVPFVFAIFPVVNIKFKKIVLITSCLCCLFSLLFSVNTNVNSGFYFKDYDALPKFIEWL